MLEKRLAKLTSRKVQSALRPSIPSRPIGANDTTTMNKSKSFQPHGRATDCFQTEVNYKLRDAIFYSSNNKFSMTALLRSSTHEIELPASRLAVFGVDVVLIPKERRRRLDRHHERVEYDADDDEQVCERVEYNELTRPMNVRPERQALPVAELLLCRLQHLPQAAFAPRPPMQKSERRTFAGASRLPELCGLCALFAAAEAAAEAASFSFLSSRRRSTNVRTTRISSTATSPLWKRMSTLSAPQRSALAFASESSAHSSVESCAPLIVRRVSVRGALCRSSCRHISESGVSAAAAAGDAPGSADGMNPASQTAFGFPIASSLPTSVPVSCS